MEYSVNVAGIVPESITDGPGIRFTLFVQGCPHNCEGCHNQQAIPFEGGTMMNTDRIFQSIKKNPLLSGVTFSGGEPFCQAKALCELAQKIKAEKLELAVYSGYTFEELLELSKKDEYIKNLLELCDILVDGRFILSQKSLALRFRGSKNQRILDLKKSLNAGQAVLESDGRWNPA